MTALVKMLIKKGSTRLRLVRNKILAGAKVGKISEQAWLCKAFPLK